MTKTMRMQVLPAALVIALLLGAGAPVALGGDPPAALYHGGTRDGYALGAANKALGGPAAPYHGGTRDGYALGAALNTKMKQTAGTVVMMR